jgi:hypothetical protein
MALIKSRSQVCPDVTGVSESGAFLCLEPNYRTPCPSLGRGPIEINYDATEASRSGIYVKDAPSFERASTSLVERLRSLVKMPAADRT